MREAAGAGWRDGWNDGFDGGPETLRINPASGWATIDVSVQAYPPSANNADVLLAAEPVLILTGANETYLLGPRCGIVDDAWYAFSIHADGTIDLLDSTTQIAAQSR